MEEAGKYIAVYLAGASGIWKGIPVGIALNLPPLYTATLVALGSISLILILYFAGNSFRQWVMNRYSQKSMEHKKEKFTKWMDRYGVIGIGILVTGLLGPIVSLLIGMLLIENTRKFLVFLLTGIVLWSYALTFFFDPLVDLIKDLL